MSLASDLYPTRPETTSARAFERASDRQSERSVDFEGLDLIRSLWRSNERKRIVLLSAGIFAVLIANMAGQVRLNHWQGAFFDALNRRDVAGLVGELMAFFAIVGVLLALVVGQTWMQEMLKVRLREWLTCHLLDEWLAPGRAYRLGLASEIGVNPDQRIEQDTRRLTELTASLGVGLLQATMLLFSFIAILWGLSNQVSFGRPGYEFTIPGYMVWCAIAYALIGSALTWRVGLPLIRLNAQLCEREADFRFAVMRVSESAESIALFGGEQDERRRLKINVDHVIASMRGLSGSLSRLTWITSGYGWIAIVVPTIVAAPAYFNGGLTLGGLMMVVGAFNQVQGSLRWFVDQFPAIADWRATLRRVSAFKSAMDKLDRIDDGVNRIALTTHVEDKLSFEGVSVLSSDGRVVIAEANVEISPGERVLIVGDSGAGKSTLFRAVAGLWPWGGGEIRRPALASMMFIPQRPYLPLGSLRAAITYPDSPDAYDKAEIEAAMQRVGMAEWLPTLDVETRLDKTLSLGQQQLIGFVRLLLHRPNWVFLDEATSALDEGSQRQAMSIFDHELRSATVLSIGHRPGLEAFHSRTLHLVRTSNGAMLHFGSPRPWDKLGGRVAPVPV